MQLQTTLRLGATPAVAGPRAVRAHEERATRPIERGNDARARSSGEQAAVLHLGAEAVDRAQQREDADAASSSEPSAADDGSNETLSEDEQRAVSDLQRRDLEVRTHEQTHRSAGGQYAGSIHLDYQRGPDGQRYAVSGSTPIDVAAAPNDPSATVRKMEVVQRAATAPANPSGADRQVAAEAAHQAQQARAEMAAERYGKARELASEKPGAQAEAEAMQAAPGPAQPARPQSGKPGDATVGQLLAVRV